MLESLNEIVAAAIAILGFALAWFEYRGRADIETADVNDQPFLRRRTRRRTRIAVVLVLLGALIAATGRIELDRRPVAHLATWFAALLATLWIFWLGFVEFFAARMHWVDRTQRNLVEIARARNELRSAEKRTPPHKKNGHLPP